MSATYIKDGSMVHGQAWRPADAGYATCYAAYLIASGQAKCVRIRTEKE